MLAYLGSVHSPSLDEVAHLPAGIVIWTEGRVDLYRVNPPLVKAIAAIPAMILAESGGSDIVYDRSPQVRPEWNVGRTFIAERGEDALALWTYARWACIPLSLIGGYLCYRWASELFSTRSGLVALTMWCLSPNILGNGAMITPDLGATSLGLLAAYCFSIWLARPSYRTAVIAGFATGVAELAKMTWIILFPLWPLLFVVFRIRTCRDETAGSLPTVGQLFVILLLATDILNLGYLGDGSFRPLGDYEFQSALLSGSQPSETGGAETGNRFRGTWLDRVPVPLPADYLIGIDVQRTDFERKKWSYLFGEFRHGGWWYYYIVAILFKMPVGFLLLGALGAGYGVAQLIKRLQSGRIASGGNALDSADRCSGAAANRWAHYLVLSAVPLCLFAVVSSQTGFSRYIRYVLPVFPFFYIAISSVARSLTIKRFSAKNIFVCSALMWGCGSSLWQFPHSLSYANELAGGPRRADRFIADANLSWGQDVFFLRDWIREHPDARPLTVAYSAAFNMAVVGIDFPMPPPLRHNSETQREAATDSGPQPGWHVLDVAYLRSHKHTYDYFHLLEPVDYIAGSMRVYYLSPESAESLRSQLDGP